MRTDRPPHSGASSVRSSHPLGSVVASSLFRARLDRGLLEEVQRLGGFAGHELEPAELTQQVGELLLALLGEGAEEFQ